ncbi:MAG: choice-of-anchor V domain-containing protein, partial [Candidatus Thermoplasmatota archaeon]|nr:choice-of-anchor V domain-containing protein [Candidatus Thermoplasmatota archaeon]
GGSSSSTTVSLSGQPSSYAPGQSYTFTVSVSNSQISNSLGGFSLDASSGTFSNPGSNAKLDSGKVTHSNRNARSWTVDWTAPPSGTGTVTVDIAGLAANGAGGNNGDSWNTATYNIPEQPPQNQAPSVSNVIISPSSPTTTDSLSVTYSYSDSDGDLESGTTIQWSRDSSIITSLDDSSSVPSSFISKDETWTVTVTPSDGIDFGSPVSSLPIIVQNTPPVVNGLTISPTDPTELDDLTMSYSFSDSDLDTESGTVIQWYLDGSRVSTYDGESTIPNVSTRAGDIWEVRITPSDGEDSGDIVTASIQIGSSNNAPLIQSLTITPTNPVTTDDIHMSYIFFDEDGDLSSSVEIQWMKDETHIPQFDGESTIPSSETSKGEVWEVSVRASDGIEFSPWTDSAPRTISNAP